MKTFLVEIQENGGSRWISVGRVKAKSAAGAIAQVARDARCFPNMTAMRATED